MAERGLWTPTGLGFTFVLSPYQLWDPGKTIEALSLFSHQLGGIIVHTTCCCEDYITEMAAFPSPFCVCGAADGECSV